MHSPKAWTSPNFRNGAFQNLSPTEVMSPDASFFKILWKFLRKPKGVEPLQPLPVIRTDLKKLEGTAIVWFGHSSYLIHHQGIHILVDPVFSGSASPIPFMVKAFAGTNTYTVDDLPDIDLLVITHNHYDHLDKRTIVKLRHRVKAVVTALGVAQDLIQCGIPAAKIRELDWWSSATPIDNVKLTATPARHFSGRGFKRGGSLWASFVLDLTGKRIYIGGDSGYDTHFKEIGTRFGPFDMVILETGQYNTSWPLIHMHPEEAAQAAVDLQAKLLLPVHWGKFALAYHPWNEPVIRVLKKAKELGVKVTTPRIGEAVRLEDAYPVEVWWEL